MHRLSPKQRSTTAERQKSQPEPSRRSGSDTQKPGPAAMRRSGFWRTGVRRCFERLQVSAGDRGARRRQAGCASASATEPGLSAGAPPFEELSPPGFFVREDFLACGARAPAASFAFTPAALRLAGLAVVSARPEAARVLAVSGLAAVDLRGVRRTRALTGACSADSTAGWAAGTSSPSATGSGPGSGLR